MSPGKQEHDGDGFEPFPDGHEGTDVLCDRPASLHRFVGEYVAHSENQIGRGITKPDAERREFAIALPAAEPSVSAPPPPGDSPRATFQLQKTQLPCALETKYPRPPFRTTARLHSTCPSKRVPAHTRISRSKIEPIA